MSENAVTISFHNRPDKTNRQHNLRNPAVVGKEGHVDLTKEHEVWHDERIEDAYERIFGDAVREYNEGKRKDRRIEDYYTKVYHDSQTSTKNPRTEYEVIVQVGSREKPVDEQTAKQIYKEFMRDWKKNNPNFEIVGCYYHADEEGQCHVHVDYVPVAHKHIYGLPLKVCLSGALEEMGFTLQKAEKAEDKRSELAIIQWERKESGRLEEICREHGLEIEHPQVGSGIKHLEQEAYKVSQELGKAKEEVAAEEGHLDELRGEVEDARRELEQAQAEYAGFMREADEKRFDAEEELAEMDRHNKAVTEALKGAFDEVDKVLKQDKPEIREAKKPSAFTRFKSLFTGKKYTVVETKELDKLRAYAKDAQAAVARQGKLSKQVDAASRTLNTAVDALYQAQIEKARADLSSEIEQTGRDRDAYMNQAKRLQKQLDGKDAEIRAAKDEAKAARAALKQEKDVGREVYHIASGDRGAERYDDARKVAGAYLSGSAKKYAQAVDDFNKAHPDNEGTNARAWRYSDLYKKGEAQLSRDRDWDR